MNSQSENPYVGPRTFRREESHLFFGREREARDLLSLVTSERLVLFHAQSGGGKSSLINTRLIPGLEKKGFEVLPVGRVGGSLPPGTRVSNIFVYNLLLSLCQREDEARPLPDPNITLKDFLREYDLEETATDGDVVPLEDEDYEILPRAVIIDQFEEILTTNLQEWEKRQDFFIQLRDALEDDEHLWVILSMREDYVAGLTPYVHLLPGKLKARLYMERMGIEAALEAVKEPVRERRRFAKGVAEKLVGNLRQIHTRDQREGQEPIAGQYIKPVQLQVVCYQLWEMLKGQEGTKITDKDLWRLAGGEDLAQFVDQALAQFYEQAIAQVVKDAPGRTEFELRDWFENKLITRTKYRAPVPQEAENTGGLDNEVVRELEDLFLLRVESRAGSRWCELAHDRLVAPILQANADWRRDHPLIQAARDWKESGEAPSQLYQGEQLAEAFKHPDAQIGLVRVFLVAGQEAEEKRELAIRAEEQTKRANELARAAQLMRWLSAGLSVVFLLAVGAAMFALRAQNQAQNAEATAVVDRDSVIEAMRIANARSLADAANKTTDPNLSVLLAIQAVRTTYDEDQTVTFGAKAALIQAVLHTRRQLVLEHTDPVLGIAFSPDGSRLVTLAGGGMAKVWDAPSGRELLSFSGHPGQISGVAFNLDGSRLATGSEDGVVKIWDLALREELDTLSGHTGAVLGVSFSPDGTRLATGGEDRTVRVWGRIASAEKEEWQVLLTLEDAHTAGISDVAFNPDGTRLATASLDQTAKVWKTSFDDEYRQLWTNTDHVTGVTFSRDSTRLATSSADGTVSVWETASGEKIQTIITPSAKIDVTSFAFNTDGTQLLTASPNENVISVWEVDSGELVSPIARTDEVTLTRIALSPDGTRLATLNVEGKIRIRETDSGKLLLTKECRGFTAEEGPLPTPSATESATTIPIPPNTPTPGTDQQGDVPDAGSGQETPAAPAAGTSVAQCDDIASIAFSLDGTHLAIASISNEITIWDIDSGQELLTFRAEGQITSLALNLDTTRPITGALLATGSEDGTVEVWDLKSRGQESLTFPGSDDVTDLAFSPDGTYLAAAMGDGAVRLYTLNVETLLEVACDHTSRNLTQDEWDDNQRALPDSPQQICSQLPIDPSIILELVSQEDKAITEAIAEAEELLEQANQTLSNAVVPGAAVAEALLDLADLRAMQSDFPGALAAVDQAIDEDPQLEDDRAADLANTYDEICRAIGVPYACREAEDLALKTDDVALNWDICRNGLGTDRGELVLPVCEHAVDLARDQGDISLNIEICRSPSLERFEDLFSPACERVGQLASRIQHGEEDQGEFDVGDGDFWAFDAEKDQIVTIAMDGEFDTYLALWGPDRLNVVAEDDDGGDCCDNSKIRDFLLPEDGTYIINARGYNERETGAYTLLLLQETVHPITFGQTVSADTAAFTIWTFEGEADQIVSIAMDTTDPGLDPYLTLLKSDGAELTSDDDSGEDLNARIQGFILPQAGRYIIKAGRTGTSAAYTLSLIEEVPQPIALGETVSENIANRTMWTFDGERGQIVSIAMDTTDTDFDPDLMLLGPDMTELTYDDDSGEDLNARIQGFILPQAGSYVIEAGRPGASAEYTLSLIEEVPQPIALGETVSENIADRAIWTFEGERGQIVSIAMDTTDPGLNPYLTLLRPNGAELASDDDSGESQNARIQGFILPQAGSYIIKAGRHGTSAAYSLSLIEEVPEPIALGDTASENIANRTMWTFEGERGQIVSIAMDTTDPGLDPYLTLLRSDGAELTSDDDSGEGPNARIQGFILPRAGSYVIQAGRTGTSAAYTLSLIEEVPEPIALGETVSENIAVRTIWTFEGERGQIVSIAMDTTDPGLDPYLTLLRSDGAKLVSDEDSGEDLNARIQGFILPRAGSYIIQAGRPGASADYTLSLIEEVLEPIALGETVSENIADRTIWTFEGERGQVVSIGMDTTDPGLNPYLTLLRSDGAELTSDDDSGEGPNARIQGFILPQAGSYIIEAGRPGASADYTLSLIEEVPEPIELGETVSENIADRAIWTFEGEADQIVSIALDTTDLGLDPYLTLLRSDGAELTSDDDSGEALNARIQGYILPEGGRYLIRAGRTVTSADYTLSLTEEVLQRIALGDTVSENIADQSLWAFEGELGQIVSIAMDTTDADFDPYLTLLGPDGRELLSDDDSGRDLNARIQGFILPEGGCYLIRAGRTGTSADYTLSLSEEVPQPIDFGEREIDDTAGVNVWTFPGVAGQVVMIRVDEADSDEEIDLTLLGPGGEKLSDRVSSSIVSLPETGPYTILVQGYREDVARYTLSLREITEELGSLTYGSMVSGDIMEASADYWAFSGNAGGAVKITIENSSFDLNLGLYNPNGALIGRYDTRDPARGYLSRLIHITGPHIVAVSGVDDSQSGPYTLSLTQTEVLNVLVWTAYTDVDEEYAHVLGALSRLAPSAYTITETDTSDENILNSTLLGHSVFLIPEQEEADSGTLAEIGSRFGPILEEFIRQGGRVISLGEWRSHEGFLRAMGLLDASYTTSIHPGAADLVHSDSPVAQGLPIRIDTEDATAGYRIGHTDATIVIEAESGDAVVVTRSIGWGQVVLIGYDYYESNNDADHLLVNAVFWPR